MKVVGKLLLTLIALLLLMSVAAYFVLQSQWGARQISAWVNNHTRYRITLGGVHHDIRRPRALQLTDFSLARRAAQRTARSSRYPDLRWTTVQYTTSFQRHSPEPGYASANRYGPASPPHQCQHPTATGHAPRLAAE